MHFATCREGKKKTAPSTDGNRSVVVPGSARCWIAGMRVGGGLCGKSGLGVLRSHGHGRALWGIRSTLLPWAALRYLEGTYCTYQPGSVESPDRIPLLLEIAAAVFGCRCCARMETKNTRASGEEEEGGASSRSSNLPSRAMPKPARVLLDSVHLLQTSAGQIFGCTRSRTEEEERSCAIRVWSLHRG